MAQGSIAQLRVPHVLQHNGLLISGIFHFIFYTAAEIWVADITERETRNKEGLLCRERNGGAEKGEGRGEGRRSKEGGKGRGAEEREHTELPRGKDRTEPFSVIPGCRPASPTGSSQMLSNDQT